MKKYRVREGSLLAAIPPLAVLTTLILLSGLGNHFIDGL